MCVRDKSFASGGKAGDVKCWNVRSEKHSTFISDYFSQTPEWPQRRKFGIKREQALSRILRGRKEEKEEKFSQQIWMNARYDCNSSLLHRKAWLSLDWVKRKSNLKKCWKIGTLCFFFSSDYSAARRKLKVRPRFNPWTSRQPRFGS
jgi:hypothetical protein